MWLGNLQIHKLTAATLYFDCTASPFFCHLMFIDRMGCTFIIPPVSLDYPLWCWEAETITVEINPDLVPSVNFVQTGYAMLYTTSHDVTVLVRRASHSMFVCKFGKDKTSMKCTPC